MNRNAMRPGITLIIINLIGFPNLLLIFILSKQSPMEVSFFANNSTDNCRFSCDVDYHWKPLNNTHRQSVKYIRCSLSSLDWDAGGSFAHGTFKALIQLFAAFNSTWIPL